MIHKALCKVFVNTGMYYVLHLKFFGGWTVDVLWQNKVNVGCGNANFKIKVSEMSLF